MSKAVWDNDVYPQEEDPYLERVPHSSTGGSTRVLSDKIKSFITHLYQVIKQGNVQQIEYAYVNQYPLLTSEYFKSQKWPQASVIADLVGNDEFFMILYRELYYRHIHAHCSSGPTIDERLEAYSNYCALFKLILDRDEPLQMELPNQLLWDIIDEFLYQYQSFTAFRARLKSRSQEEIEILRSKPTTWNVHSVINVLQTMVNKSNINEQLRVFAESGDPNKVAGEFGKHGLYKMLGFFSLIGLCRLHCHLADYYQALNVLKCIDITRQDMYHEVQSCHITTGYYVGFSYLMMRRYQDAIRTISGLLAYYHRHRSNLQQSVSPEKFDYVTKMTEQMYHLLCMCLTLHPMRVEEVVQQVMKDKYADKMLRLLKIDLKEFESTFNYGCPKFLSPVIPSYDDCDTNYHQLPQLQQTQIFMKEIEEQFIVPNLRSFLKLYSSLPISKLASFLQKEESVVHRELMCFKHKLQNMTCVVGSSSLEGEFQSGSDMDFFIDGDMIRIADTKVQPNYADFFVKQMVKLKEVNLALSTMNDKVKSLRTQPTVSTSKRTMSTSSYAGALSVRK